MAWIDSDKMMKLIDGVRKPDGVLPAQCPVCGKSHAHLLMHRADGESEFGSLWIWCDSCGSYTHCSFKIPEWWVNPPFIDEDKLDSLVDYPANLQSKIDAWVNALPG